MNDLSRPAVPTTQGDMRALIDALAGLGTARKNPDADGAHFVMLPPDWQVAELPRHELPPRPQGTVKLRDAASFIRYWIDHAQAHSRIYATLQPAAFVAVFDDFDLVNPSLAIAAQAAYRGFRALFEVPASREWTLWAKANREQMSQLRFAEFLQDNLPDIVEPEGATLLEMALNFEAVQAGSFVAAQRLQDGSHNLAWKADNNAGGTVRLPEHITLKIPVFENDEAAVVAARLRYRIKDGGLAIWYELVRPHKVMEQAFRNTWARIAKDTGAVVLLGTPE